VEKKKEAQQQQLRGGREASWAKIRPSESSGEGKVPATLRKKEKEKLRRSQQEKGLYNLGQNWEGKLGASSWIKEKKWSRMQIKKKGVASDTEKRDP